MKVKKGVKISYHPICYLSLSKEAERKLDRIIEEWFEECITDKIIRKDIKRKACLEKLKLRIKGMLKQQDDLEFYHYGLGL